MEDLRHLIQQLDGTQGPLVVPWPQPGNLGAFVTFERVDEWAAFLARFDLAPAIPLIVSAKYRRAQKLYLLGWLDADIIKAGELMAFATLELALNDQYGDKVKADRKPKLDDVEPPRKSFAKLLDYMVSGDGLTDDQLPSIRTCGGTVIERLKRNGLHKPSLAEIRNKLAHGYPFDGYLQSGLLELIRDLINHAYRPAGPRSAAT